MYGRTSLFALSFVALASVPTPRGTEIAFAPSKGLALQKSFTSRSESSLVSSESTMNGEPQDQEREQDSQSETQLEFVDVYIALADGRATKLERTYGEFLAESTNESSFDGNASEFVSSGSGELDEIRVRFEWDEDDEEYTASSEDDIDTDVLEELRCEHDFLALLPPDEVDEDDEWSVDPKAFQRLLDPSEGLPMEWERTRNGEEIEMGERDEQEEPEIDESHDGEVTARFAGLREVDGIELAVIALEGELTTERHMEGSQEGEHGTSEFSNDTTTTLEFKAECLWNLAGGHMHSFTLNGETTTDNRSTSTSEMFGQTFEFESESATEGEISMEILFEAAE